ncbi:MAG: hypothetical protein Q7K03_08255 [Dehalococcoidia bacterium]|nr:hypothetical protein [Dehalococcoidia bacterium]
MIPFRKRRKPPFGKWPELFLVALVKQYEKAPGVMSAPGFGETPLDLAVEAGIMSNAVFKSEEYKTYLQGYEWATFQEVTIADVLEATRMMAMRGWAESQRDKVQNESIWLPTLAGIDYARRIMRPWWLKLLDGIKGDLRSILVSVITAIAATVLTTLLLKLLGWFK